MHGPGVYVLSNAAPKGFLRDGKTDGLVFAVLDEEALLIDDEELFVAERLDTDVLSASERYFCWGPHQRDVVTAAFPDLTAQPLVTGNPRLELLEPRFHALYADELSDIRRQYGSQYVLINSNLLESDDDPWRSRMRELLMALARALAAHRTDVTVVFRPHPADLAECSLDTTGLPNLVVSSEGPIAPWLAGASAVFHNSCTTAIEARIMERPVFAYRPLADVNYGALPNALSVTVRSVEEACAALDAVLAGDVPEHPDLTPLDRYLVRPGSGEPSRRIADALAGLTVPVTSEGPDRPGPVERLRIRWKGPPAKPWNRIALRARLPAIRARYALIATAAGLDHAVTIRAPQPSLIEITPG